MTWALCTPLLALPTAAAAEPVAERAATPLQNLEHAHGVMRDLTSPSPFAGAEATPTLRAAVTAAAEQLDLHLHQHTLRAASWPAATVDAALARVLVEISSCHATSAQLRLDRAVAAVPSPALSACAVRMRAAADGAARVLEAAQKGAPLDLWPVLRYSPGNSHDEYRHDYLLVVDAGGNDLYDNNAGGNLIDLKRGPEGSPAPLVAPARGCEVAARDPLLGQTPGSPGPECVPSAALLLDLGGNDTYGVLKSPHDLDATCTAAAGRAQSPLVRRVGTLGAGFAGVGIALDRGGNDTYLGKALTQGAGHIGGIGFLEDTGAGNDTYRAVRTAQGVGVLGGLGLLRDDGGNDDYGFYEVPQGMFEIRPPNDPVCDRDVRQLQGAGILAGVGFHVDAGGNDTYRADRPSVAVFPATHQAPSQGAGTLAGAGVLLDLAGHDTYLSRDGREAVDRTDGATVGPVTRSGQQVEAGMFVDAE